MRFTVPRDAFQAAVKACSPAINGRPSMPILAGVHLTVTDNWVALRAFDHETDITTTVNARVDEGGVALVSHRLLMQILSATTTAMVTVEAEDSRLKVMAGRAAWRLPLMTVNSYPALPQPVPPVGSVDCEAFRDAVERVVTAASSVVGLDLPLHATCLEFGPDDLTMVSTDKYQLHTEVLPLKRADDDPGVLHAVLVPASRLAAVAKSLTGETVTIGVDTHRVSLSDGATTVTTALVAMKAGWVKWRSLFDSLTQADPAVYTFDRDELLTALRQAVLVADVQESKARHVTLTIGRGEAVAQATSDHDGDAAVPFLVAGYDTDDLLEWVVNADFLIGTVIAADTDPVQFTQRSAKHPVGIGPVGQPATQIVMPIRVKP